MSAHDYPTRVGPVRRADCSIVTIAGNQYARVEIAWTRASGTVERALESREPGADPMALERELMARMALETSRGALARFARPGDRAYVRMPDGRVRLAMATRHPDTFFSTPARVALDGRTVYGYVSLDSDDLYAFTPDHGIR